MQKAINYLATPAHVTASMHDVPLTKWVNLPVIETIYSQSNKFLYGCDDQGRKFLKC